VENRRGSKIGGGGKHISGIFGKKLQGWKTKEDELWKAEITL